MQKLECLSPELDVRTNKYKLIEACWQKTEIYKIVKCDGYNRILLLEFQCKSCNMNPWCWQIFCVPSRIWSVKVNDYTNINAPKKNKSWSEFFFLLYQVNADFLTMYPNMWKISVHFPTEYKLWWLPELIKIINHPQKW